MKSVKYATFAARSRFFLNAPERLDAGKLWQSSYTSYQKDLAKIFPSAPLPFHFGHRTTVEPGQAEIDPFVKRGSWKGSILMVARGQAQSASKVA